MMLRRKLVVTGATEVEVDTGAAESELIRVFGAILAANKGTFCHERTTLVAIMEISPLLLARLQFSLSLNFHVLFAAMAMALGWVLLVFRFNAWHTNHPVWMEAYRFWVRIFALTFFLALASAIPVLLELGILWPALIERVGNVAGPLIAFGITTLFVIKSVFLGVMFFGQRRVSPGSHVFSVAMVAAGLTLTLFWELVLVAWSHTPAGSTLIDGRYQVVDWTEVIFNPTLPWLLLQWVAGSFLMTGCLLLCVSAWQATRRPLENDERLLYRFGLTLALIAGFIQVFALDGHVRNLARTQPVTAAAIVGVWQTGTQPKLIILGWPQAGEDASTVVIGVESGAARWLGQDAAGQSVGLDQAGQDAPLASTLFWLTRFVVYGSLWIMGLACVTLWMMFRRGGDPAKYPAWLLQTQVWLGSIAAGVWLCSWNLTELGRFPFMVWDTLRQEDLLTATAPALLAAGLFVSILIYTLLFHGWLRMLFHAARYGVVPVRKPGVRT